MSTETNDDHAIVEWLAESARPLLISHRRPDGDALGSLVAMARIVESFGKQPLLTVYESLPSRYARFANAATWHNWADQEQILASECDGVIIVDTCSLAQLEPIARFLAVAPRTLVIDHHATRDPIGTRDGDLRFFDETASATALIIAELAAEVGIELSKPLAEALFVGIATDSGWFRFSNTDARTLRAATRLVDAGAVPNELYDEIYQREPAAKLKLIARLLSNLEMHANGRLAVMSLRPADFEATGADDSLTEDLVNEAARLGTTEATILFTQEDTALVRINFRSKRELDVSEVARRYGGGGHARAAGARVHGAWEDVVPRVIAEVAEHL